MNKIIILILVLNRFSQILSNGAPSSNLKPLFLNKQLLLKLFLKYILPSKTFLKLPKMYFSQSTINEFEKGKNSADVNLDMAQLITKNNLPVETHEVITKDGYTLKIFRIPSSGPVVFFMHGLLSSSDDWITNGRNRSLAYMLAERGYDVWFGNARGNIHSRTHVTLNPEVDRYRYWNFSWDEIGRYDLPAMIDYILDATGMQTLIYIGHSQGSTSFFVLCSVLPEYNKKISFFVALSSPVFMSRVLSLFLQILARLGHRKNQAFVKLTGPEYFANDLQAALKSFICDDISNIIEGEICIAAVFVALGVNYKQINYERLATISKHFISGSSAYQLVHFAQSIVSGEFRYFDHYEDNIKVYGNATPPDYPLEKVTVEMAIFHGEGDWLNHICDVSKLLKRLINVNYTFHQVPENFAHLDYLFAKDVKRLLYDKVLRIIESKT